MTLSDVLELKGRQVVVALTDATVDDVIQLMCDDEVGSVIIRTQAGSMLGIISERDVVRAVGSASEQLTQSRASDIMTSPIPIIDVTATIVDGLQTMTDQRCRHLIVTDENVAIGIVSIGDLVKFHIRGAGPGNMTV